MVNRAIASFLFVVVNANAKPPSWAASGKNLAALRAVPVRLLLPSHLPPGHILFDYELENQKTKHANYAVTYLKDKDHWFRIESADSVGDADWDDAKTTQIKSTLFGEVVFQVAEPAAGEAVSTPKIISNWLPCLGAHKDPKKWPATCRFYHLFGYGLSPDEAIKVINSLTAQN